jgi:hypothetical protein
LYGCQAPIIDWYKIKNCLVVKRFVPQRKDFRREKRAI